MHCPWTKVSPANWMSSSTRGLTLARSSVVRVSGRLGVVVRPSVSKCEKRSGWYGWTVAPIFNFPSTFPRRHSSSATAICGEVGGETRLDGNSLISPCEWSRDPDCPMFARNVSKVMFEVRVQGEHRVELASDTLHDSNISKTFSWASW